MASIRAGLPEHELLNTREEPLVMVSNTNLDQCIQPTDRGVQQNRKLCRRIFALKDSNTDLYLLAIDLSEVNYLYTQTSQERL